MSKIGEILKGIIGGFLEKEELDPKTNVNITYTTSDSNGETLKDGGIIIVNGKSILSEVETLHDNGLLHTLRYGSLQVVFFGLENDLAGILFFLLLKELGQDWKDAIMTLGSFDKDNIQKDEWVFIKKDLFKMKKYN